MTRFRTLAVLVLAQFALAFGLAGLAHGEPVDAGYATVDLISERTVATPGETIYLALDKTLEDGWHVYWRNAGDAGLPPQIFWDEAPFDGPTEDGDFFWPLPELLPVDDAIMDYGYSEHVTLPFRFTVPSSASGPIRFVGVADYLICKDVCIPESAPVSFTLQVGGQQVPDAAGAARIAAALAQSPTSFEGQSAATLEDGTLRLSLSPETVSLDDTALRFFPHEDEIVHSAAQAQRTGPNGASLDMVFEPRETLGETLDGMLVVTRADGARRGYHISAPVTDAPLAGTFGSAVAAQVDAPAVNLLALAGLALLGGLILNLMPCVLPVLSIKAMGMVQAAGSGQASHLKSHGLWYTAGVLISFAALALAFIILRGLGEFWALGSLLQYPVVVAGLALGAFVLGLWLLGVFEAGTSLQNVGSGVAGRGGNLGAFATGALAATAGAPCVGPFVGASLGAVMQRPAPEVFFIYLMLGLGLALPFLALSFLPGLHRYIPKPGPWMERVKQFFAFPMFLTAAALLFVLGDQAGTGAIGWLVMGATLIAFGIWTLRSAGGGLKPFWLALGAAAILGGIALPMTTARTQANADAGSTAYAARYETELWSPERVAQLQAEGRGIFVDFTATWCMICQANKRSTLTRPEVLAAFNAADITFLVADYTNKDDVIAEELQRRGRPGVPMYLLYAPGASEPEILPQTLTPGLVMREVDAATGRR